jgi:ribosomal protein S18 acetylase RimI-like enzyme
MRIRPAGPGDWDTVRVLFREYLSELDFDLDFQHVEEELAALPGPYAAPHGAILLANMGEADGSGTPQRPAHAPGESVGVVAVKPLPDTDDGHSVCEMKRLFVRPSARGRGIGHDLACAIIDVAQKMGYDRMRLDTVASMHAARAVYQSLGFEERSAYYNNPLTDVVYYERALG